MIIRRLFWDLFGKKRSTLFFCDRAELVSDSGNDSVEGIMYSEKEGVVMTGQFVDQKEVDTQKINRMGLWFKPWFYRHVQTFLQKVSDIYA